MSQRRMFSPDITESDAFLEMPEGSQNLYFHLGMYADDDGFVGPRKIMRLIGSKEDDLKVLIAKRFLLFFENGVVVVKHWRINNLIRKDWYRPTQYFEQAAALFVKENGAYSLDESQGKPLLDSRLRLVNEPSTQDSIGKDSIGKKREEKVASPDKPESSLSWLGSFNEKEEFLCGVPAETLKAFSEKYKASEDQIRNKCEDLVLWSKTSRKVKKNYKTFLQVILKKDFGIRTAADKELEERVRLTHERISSPFGKSLAAKMKM